MPMLASMFRIKTLKSTAPVWAFILGAMLSWPKSGPLKPYAGAGDNETNPWLKTLKNSSSHANQTLNMMDFQSEEEESSRVWFIMPTRFYMKFQEPTLVRIAQALYPSRQFVTWVIIAENTRLDYFEEDMAHLEKIVRRFSIPYVLLSTAAPGVDLGTIFGDYLDEFDKPPVLARQLGLLWVLQNAERGVVMFASEQFTYHFQTFSQIRHTKRVSVWPVERRGYESHQHFVPTTVIDAGTTSKVGSGNNCLLVVVDNIGVTISGLAFNIEYFKTKSISLQNIWKLAMEMQSSILTAVEIEPEDIQPVETCNQTLVWRTKIKTDHAMNLETPRQNRLHPILEGTNVELLLRYIYRDRFDDFFTFSRKWKAGRSGQVYSSEPPTWIKQDDKC